MLRITHFINYLCGFFNKRYPDASDRFLNFAPPGHFYSPIPSFEEIVSNENEIFDTIPTYIPGINLNEKNQLKLLEEFKRYYDELPFSEFKREDMRYYHENNMYTYSDGIFLYCMIRHLKPKRIIEVGAGFSSCNILDCNELFFNNSVSITFIEPYPKMLYSNMKEGDKERVEIIDKRLQGVSIEKFSELASNDILFIDSTHISKINSDVNYILFEILPSLRPGVYIHFHDIFYPFQYPKKWFYQGIAWNEAYILRAFLQYNNNFEIILFNTFLEHFHEEKFREIMPLCLKNKGGSIWLRKNG